MGNPILRTTQCSGCLTEVLFSGDLNWLSQTKTRSQIVFHQAFSDQNAWIEDIITALFPDKHSKLGRQQGIT
jgi:hypothetical protein